jgi:hypothetical protein
VCGRVVRVRAIQRVLGLHMIGMQARNTGQSRQMHVEGGARAGIRGVCDTGATPAAKIQALGICRPLSMIVHPYPLTLYGVSS